MLNRPACRFLRRQVPPRLALISGLSCCSNACLFETLEAAREVQRYCGVTDVARRFPLSGGYIRNSTLRAAFLAAQEQRPLSQEHLLRAIALEYRELGKLSTSGRME